MELPIRSNGSPMLPNPALANGHEISPTRSELPQAARSADELLSRCRTLDNEIEAFRVYLASKRRENSVDCSHYRGVVRSELKNLERLTAKLSGTKAESTPPDSDDEGLGRQSIASSNVPFLESLWNAAKSTTGLVALQKRYGYGEDVSKVKLGSTTKAERALVDVVAKDGMEWIKVSLISNHRILMDKAREGWGGDDSEASGSEGDEDEDDPDGGIPIVKIGEALLAASRQVRIQTKHPKIRMLLPKVVERRVPAIDKILQRLRASGLSVECDGASVSYRSLESALETMTLPETMISLTDTINIDCTILLALVSDFSHCEVVAEPWFHKALKRQLEIEDDEVLLPNTLYPIICGRRLVCTSEAAKRMREIVSTIGTPGEKARSAIFMGDESNPAEDQLDQLSQWSRYNVPQDLRLPVQIVDKDSASSDSLPAVADVVREGLTPINQSVFLYGWSMGVTTITSNRSVVKQIEAILDEHAKEETDWPKIWLSPTSRSLVGKEKGRK